MPKRLIVCSDGTWNEPDSDRPTNVVKMSRLILPSDPSDGRVQVVFYDPGVGTGNKVDQLLGGMFGTGLDQNIRDAYRFLAQNYEPDDAIYLFGFSRGAYTARSTAGFIRNAGILRKEHLGRIGEAFRLYRDGKRHPTHDDSIAFRRAYSHETRIIFVGVWDTVGSRGVPLRGVRDALVLVPGVGRLYRRRFEFHDTALSSYVDNAFHAVSIDEKRDGFVPSLWTNDPAPGQTVEQAWFPGVHSDIGGGYAEAGLSDVALHWMAEKARGCDLALDESQLASSTQPDPLGRLHDSRKGFYRALRARPRRYGQGTNESISDAARTRHAAPSADYAPENLAAHLR